MDPDPEEERLDAPRTSSPKQRAPGKQSKWLLVFYLGISLISLLLFVGAIFLMAALLGSDNFMRRLSDNGLKTPTFSFTYIYGFVTTFIAFLFSGFQTGAGPRVSPAARARLQNFAKVVKTIHSEHARKQARAKLLRSI